MPKALAILLAFLLLALSVAAAAFGVANIYRSEAVTVIEKWDWPEDEPVLPVWAWEQVYRYLWLANRLAPFDAQILAELGELYELRVDEVPAPGNGSHTDHELALGYYRQSLLLRPAWPYVWADLALLKLSQKQFDAEFALALQCAIDLGPWQSIVQASIASGGLSVWDKLPARLQTDIEHAVARGLSSGSKLMPGVARQYGLITTDG
ncbi:MAG: hypothetical protein WBN81_01975 [Gammaproteobacteria bacterium]